MPTILFKRGEKGCIGKSFLRHKFQIEKKTLTI